MSNQVFVLLCDLADFPTVVLLMSCKLSYIPYYCSRTLAVKKGGRNITIFGRGYKPCNDQICIHFMSRN